MNNQQDAVVCIERLPRFLGGLFKIKVKLDKKFLGAVPNGKRVSFPIKPGKHVIEVKAAKTKIEFYAEPGKTYYFRTYCLISFMKQFCLGPVLATLFTSECRKNKFATYKFEQLR